MKVTENSKQTSTSVTQNSAIMLADLANISSTLASLTLGNQTPLQNRPSYCLFGSFITVPALSYGNSALQIKQAGKELHAFKSVIILHTDMHHTLTYITSKVPAGVNSSDMQFAIQQKPKKHS